ncbi:MAG TPA: ATP-binding protein [Gemmatimonadaceae bacterium]
MKELLDSLRLPPIFPVMRYVVAVVSVGFALLLAQLLELYFVGGPVSLVICAVIVSAWFGGMRAAALAVALSLLGFDWYFVRPVHSLAMASDEIPRVILMVVVSLFVGWISARQRSTAASLRRTSDQLRTTVDELRTANETLIAEDAERRRAEEALRETRDELARVSRVTAMGELTASLAHEVNQPIAAALINANACSRWLAGTEPNIEEARAAAGRIVDDAARAAEIINRVRLLFRKGEAKRESVDVNEIVQEMLVLLREEALQQLVAVKVDLAADLPTVMADRVQLQQVMMNLIMNSIDAMREISGERALTINTSREANSHLLVLVSDTGPGLPLEHDQIFRPFFTTKTHGMGMGLAISRSIIESHSGRIWASNGDPRGARFHITLPVSEGTNGQAPVA